MTDTRTLLVSLFSNPEHFFCRLGFFLTGNRRNGVKVIFYPTGAVREFNVYVEGFRTFSGQYYSNRIPSHLINYRKGVKHGEAIYCLNSGLVRKHVLYGPAGEVRATADAMQDFTGYLVTDERLNMASQYEKFGKWVRKAISQNM